MQHFFRVGTFLISYILLFYMWVQVNWRDYYTCFKNGGRCFSNRNVVLVFTNMIKLKQI